MSRHDGDLNDLTWNPLRDGDLFGVGFRQYDHSVIRKSLDDVKNICHPKCLKDVRCAGFHYRINARYDGRENGDCWYFEAPLKLMRGQIHPEGLNGGGVWVKITARGGAGMAGGRSGSQPLASFAPKGPGSGLIYWILIPVLVVSIAIAVGLVWRCRRRRKTWDTEEGGHQAKEERTDFERCPKDPSNPAWAAISLDQLRDLRRLAQHTLGPMYIAASMYDISRDILQPLGDEHGVAYAHYVNGADIKLTDIFVSHAWAENFDEFVDQVLLPFATWRVKPNVWICATALVQSTNPSIISTQVSTADLIEAPFTRALSAAKMMLVVRNSAVDIYQRIWCCWELYIGHQQGLVQKLGGLMVVGPEQAVQSDSVDVVSALASSAFDKQNILDKMLAGGASYAFVNNLLNEIRLQKSG